MTSERVKTIAWRRGEINIVTESLPWNWGKCGCKRSHSLMCSKSFSLVDTSSFSSRRMCCCISTVGCTRVILAAGEKKSNDEVKTKPTQRQTVTTVNARFIIFNNSFSVFLAFSSSSTPWFRAAQLMSRLRYFFVSPRRPRQDHRSVASGEEIRKREPGPRPASIKPSNRFRALDRTYTPNRW